MKTKTRFLILNQLKYKLIKQPKSYALNFYLIYKAWIEVTQIPDTKDRINKFFGEA